jgi:hypothetical protein
MPPLNLNEFSKTLRELLSKYSSFYFSDRSKRKTTYGLKPGTGTPAIPAVFKDIPARLSKSLSQGLAQMRKTTLGEDYNAVVTRFIPENASAVFPRLPAGSRGIQWMDVDGDRQNELISSYRYDNELWTVVLKKENDKWRKMAEINHLKYDTLYYRGKADIAGEGKVHLLVGLASKGSAPVLHGYSFDNGKMIENFSHSYHRLDVLLPAQTDKRQRLALWSRQDTGGYDIELLQWNGTKLEPNDDTALYYSYHVVPQYVSNVKRAPASPSNWYNLADALVKAGAYRDASMVIKIGMMQDVNSTFKEKFEALNGKIAVK